MDQPTLLAELAAFRHRTPIQLRYSDIDMLQHVNNARYLTFMEDARIQYSLDVLAWDGRWESFGMILARTEVDFLRPVLLGEQVVAYSAVTHLGTKSFTMQYRLVVEGRRTAGGSIQPQTPVLVAKAVAVLVAYDPVAQVSIPIPNTLAERIRAWEGELA